MRLSWIEYGLKIAEAAALRSEDPKPVGACILRKDNSIAAVGYNGYPAGVNINASNRHPFVIHAEQNALRWIRPEEGEIICVTHHPCAECIKIIASYKIKTVYWSLIPGERNDLMHIGQVAKAMGLSLNRLGNHEE